MNTKIKYLYRDAGNYKTPNNCIVAGEITEDQKKAILNSLFDEEYFVPSVVGLPETRFGSINEDDTAFFELDKDSFVLTNEEADTPITIGELTSRFIKAASADAWEKAEAIFTGNQPKLFDEDSCETDTVIETCPHCEHTVEMVWDIEKNGFKAFCPFCGRCLMLCSECIKREGVMSCDYVDWNQSCHHNPPRKPWFLEED